MIEGVLVCVLLSHGIILLAVSKCDAWHHSMLTAGGDAPGAR